MRCSQSSRLGGDQYKESDFHPKPIGFAASVSDNDKPGQFDQELLLSTVKDLQWNKPATLGNLFF